MAFWEQNPTINPHQNPQLGALNPDDKPKPLTPNVGHPTFNPDGLLDELESTPVSDILHQLLDLGGQGGPNCHVVSLSQLLKSNWSAVGSQDWGVV